MTPGHVSRCRSCRAKIIWTLTERGSRMPVDFDPSPEGNVAIRPREDGGWESVIAGPLEPVEGCTAVRRTSHFATCKFADQHRRSHG